MRLILFLVLSGAAHAAPPVCKRVESLKALATTLKDARAAAAKGPVELFFASMKKDVEGWKERGVRVVADREAEFTTEQAQELARLVKDAKVELCVTQNAPVTQKYSLQANAKYVKPVLTEISKALAMDRATIVASHLQEDQWKCRSIAGTALAVTNVAPADRLEILVNGLADSLEECRCPDPETEKAWALTSLLADVWHDKQTCAPMTIGKPGEAKALKLEGKVSAIVTALGAAGAKGVELK
jgi:hypothetical protein